MGPFGSKQQLKLLHTLTANDIRLLIPFKTFADNSTFAINTESTNARTGVLMTFFATLQYMSENNTSTPFDDVRNFFNSDIIMLLTDVRTLLDIPLMRRFTQQFTQDPGRSTVDGNFYTLRNCVGTLNNIR